MQVLVEKYHTLIWECRYYYCYREVPLFLEVSVSDRGDDYFSNFQTIMAEVIEEQKRGDCQYYVARNPFGDIVSKAT